MKIKFKDSYKMMGLNIAYYRKKLGYTQENLAERIGIDQTHMSKIEVAAVGISFDVFFEIADALGVSPKQLLDFER
ncbi:MAG: helix-turn-helix transcriptional regulator [bacterium]|nr:helix-turn-helix transcriptional regulator [bacterium]